MKQHKKELLRPPEDAVWYLALGGTGEIGMNMSLYGTAGKWLMVDCGITFGDESTPGVEIIMPDISFIAERKNDLVAIVLTHGHEDHIGAVAHLWPQLQCPIYATKFTAELLRSKLSQADLAGRAKVIEIPQGGRIDLDPFHVEFVTVTHSIPEANMLAIKTQHGTVLHTGDWKLDPDPIIGHLTDDKRLKELGDEGIMALVGDSTNAPVAGHSGSELTVQHGLYDLFGTINQRIIVTSFSSNIARLKSIAIAAKKRGRYVTLVGRSLWRNAELAEECGYLPEFNQFLSESEAMQSPRDKIVMICTGCQGEPRSALPRIVAESHPEISIDEGDTVIFSSFDIPGNEKSIARLRNRLLAQGLKVITRKDAPVHVSGHPAKEELVELYGWTRPQLSVPVHGESRHQMDHAAIATECQVPNTLIPSDGQIIRLGPGFHEVVTEVHSGRMALDGRVLRRLDHAVAKDRKKMGHSGAVVITLVMDERGKVVQDPRVSLMGLVEDGNHASLQGDVAAVAEDAVDSMPKSARTNDAAVQHAVSQAARRLLNDVHGKKPVMEVHLVRV